MIRNAVFAVLAFAGAADAQDLRLGFPVDCALGVDCFIQNYVDRDPGPGKVDVGCGHLTYDGHSGTDIALLDMDAMHAGVSVRPIGPGRVRATRDGMPDINARDPNAPDLTSRSCGNAVIIDHGDGWVVSYCHLKQGSVTVQTDAQVTVDDVIGQIGLSGRTEFPHLHLTLRHQDRIIDPFNPNAAATCGAIGDALWSQSIPYTPAGFINAGFSPGLPQFDDIKEGSADHATLPANAPALVAWAQVFGSRAGDVLAFTITGPRGVFLETEAAFDKNQVRAFRAVGRKLRAAAWRSGRYTLTVQFRRDGRVLQQISAETTVD